MPHILHVIDSLNIGGAERMLVDIANATIKYTSHRVSVCVTRTGFDLARDLDPKIQLLVLERKKRFDYAPMRKFGQFVINSNIDLIHVHGRSSLSFVATLKTLRMIDCPVVFHDHRSIEIDDSIPLWLKLWGRRYVSEYVGVYNKLAEWALNAGLPRSDIHTIGNAIDLNRLIQNTSISIRDEFSIPSDTRVGVSVCGIRKEKGIDLLIQSISQMNTKTPFCIVIIGGVHDNVYIEECKRQIEALDIGDKVIFAGQRSDASSLIHDADFALMSSRSESGPLVLIEYMALGLPFVAFEVGDISQKAASLGVPGFVPPEDVIAFASLMQTLIELPQSTLKQRGQKGQSIAQDHFSIQSKIDDWIAVYRKAIDKR